MMIDGRCPKCQRAEVRERVARLPAPQQSALRVRLLVCAACGYTELWTPDEQLGMVDDAEWARVPLAPGETAGGATVRLEPTEPRAYTGKTERLVAPEPAAAAGFAPKRRCPSCQSERLIEGLTLVDKNQSIDQQLSIVIKRQASTFFLPQWTVSVFRAWICAECGYASLFVSHPGELYEAHQEAQ